MFWIDHKQWHDWRDTVYMIEFHYSKVLSVQKKDGTRSGGSSLALLEACVSVCVWSQANANDILATAN